MDRRLRYSRLTGVIYVIGAIFGLLISLGGLLFLWNTRDEVVGSITGTVALVGRSLDATRETITVVGRSLDQAAADLKTVHTMLDGVAGTLEDSGGLIRSTGNLVGNDMIEFVTDTQTSLQSVQNSARMVDNVLTTINGIPLLGPWLGRGYNPEVPLQQSVEDVSRSLSPLPESFRQIRRDLEVAAGNASTLQVEVETLSGQIAEIETSVSEAQAVVEDYRGILTELQTRFDRFEAYLPRAINTTYIGLTGIFIWIFITQLGALIHGIELMG